MAATYAEVRERDGRHLRRWRGDWYTYAGVRWQLAEEEDVRADLVTWLTDETTQTRGREGDLMPWTPSRDTDIVNVIRMLGDIVHRPSGADTPRGTFLSNCWIDENLVPQDYSHRVFNTSAAKYEWNIKATCPNTLKWLSNILSKEDIELLRQWLGYLVSGRTDLQKMLVLIGPSRSGKGTLLWLMEELLGPGSTASYAALSKLSETFGLQPLIGARLAVMPDVRWAGKDASEAVPELLSIIGCDSRDVNRKNMKVWRGRLDARFVAASNDTPSLADASGALAGRMLTITMGKSFLGKEDPNLIHVIRKELPGILQWALGGLRTLTEVGRFVEPASSVAAREEVRQSSNPVYLFVDEVCTLGAYGKVDLDNLYRSYEMWCQKSGQSRLPNSILVRQIRNTFRGKVESVRHRDPITGVRHRTILGLTLVRQPEYADSPLYEE